MHHNGEAHTFSNSKSWYISMLFETICFWAVPVFFMLTGAKLMNYRKRYSTKEFVKKRVRTVVIPWISWLFICAGLKLIKGSLVINSSTDIVSGIVNNDFMGIYGFFPAIIMVYLSLPVLSKLLEVGEYQKIFVYMIVTAFVFVDFMPYALKIIGVEMNQEFLFPLDTGYLQYVLFGYLLSTHKTFARTEKNIIYILAILMCAVRYALAVASNGNEALFSYKSFYAAPLAVGVFVFFESTEEHFRLLPNKANGCITILSRCTLGVYLVHMIIMYQVVWKIPGLNQPYVWKTISLLVTYILSIMVVGILKKVPVVRCIVP